MAGSASTLTFESEEREENLDRMNRIDRIRKEEEKNPIPAC